MVYTKKIKAYEEDLNEYTNHFLKSFNIKSSVIQNQYVNLMQYK